jgi:hypothetical protein
MDISNFSDEDLFSDEYLKKLMEKYREKQERYNQMYNECTVRNQKILLNIHIEQIRRWGNARMDISND